MMISVYKMHLEFQYMTVGFTPGCPDTSIMPVFRATRYD